MLQHSLAREISSLDSDKTYKVHREIILSKPFLLDVYKDYYNRVFECIENIEDPSMKIVEIGAGGFNASEIRSGITATDLDKTEFVHEIQDAQNIDYDENSVDVIFIVGVLHHLPRPRGFFDSASRCLKDGGKLIMIEPYYSPWASFVFKSFHHEPSMDSEEWEFNTKTGGRLTDANHQMPHNIFVRDIDIFKSEYPELVIDRICKFDFLTYILSGGLSYKCAVPAFMSPFVFLIEKLLSPFMSLLASRMLIDITVRKSQTS